MAHSRLRACEEGEHLGLASCRGDFHRCGGRSRQKAPVCEVTKAEHQAVVPRSLRLLHLFQSPRGRRHPVAAARLAEDLTVSERTI